jgi:serine/threonine protein kinase
MTSKHCAHGDLKPGNILVSSSSPDEPPYAVFTDFSSSVLSTDTDKTPIGGATYDYIDPTLMTKASANALPTSTTDLWALAITLLVVVIGTSPYNRVAPNEIMKREISKQGDPLKWLAQGENGMRSRKRLEALGEQLGWDVAAWFGLVLKRDLSERVCVEEWKAVLERGVGIDDSML